MFPVGFVIRRIRKANAWHQVTVNKVFADPTLVHYLSSTNTNF